MKRVSSLVLVCSVLVAFAGIASADEYSRKSLQGLKSVYVVVEDLQSDAVKDGLNKEDLQTLVELQLRKSGIKVVTEEEYFGEAGMPHLYLNVNTKKQSENLYAINIEVSFKQTVMLKRNPNIQVTGVTWNDGGVGSIGRINMVSGMRELISKYLDRFINDYLAVNPK